MCQTSVCFSVLILSQQRFGATDIKALGTVLRSWTNCVRALRQISVIALFYLEDSRRIHPRRREESEGARQQEREREKSAWLLLLYVFSPLGLPYANWA